MVSVIVPNYNHAAYLERRINSILNQTYQYFEIILLDDYSNDNSQSILAKYKNHPKVSHIVLNEFNSGSTFKQWQKGIELASADLIWIAESDDWAEPTLLEELVSPLLDNPDISISFCQTLCVNSDNNILYRTESNFLLHTIHGNKFVSERMFYGNSIMNASMAVFRKSQIENFDWNFTSMRFCGDWFFWVQLALTGSVFESGKYLNYFFKHGKDVTSKAVSQGLFFKEGYKIMLFIKKNVSIETDKYFINLERLVDYYFEQKKFFADEHTDKEVLECLALVDQNTIKLIQKRNYKPSKSVQLISKLFYLAKGKLN
ncbi:glycosyltransferase family 2 protein [Pontibacter sp. BT310]|uniref:Glycosyltransferase n=1 Tax=Pontibacter populi TaxID=890055 RepID=A0ABS6XF77_9BACT|nr:MULTISPECIES: glycosyltransferase family 2 protein [Pontibacter]MBJ6119791.1 glycosyltransferase family 2 protein [Pontibacter sp. BT310]MBR0572220.1 glycosyltransferase family 2 protein [Microvirga sp. STS03]MBW3366644.1 glycosyltransferase [Pontibacter populi]